MTPNQFADIRNKINTYIPITDEEFESLYHILDYKEYPKNTILTTVGEVEDYFYIVLSGFLRLYHIVDGKEYTTSFTTDSNTTSSYESFIKRTPSKYILETCTRASVVRLSYEKVYKAYDENFLVERLGRISTEQNYIRKINQQIEINSFTAEERYIKIKNEWPDLIENIPQHKIATYLGIAPESLSRIRKNLD